ncbi:pseudouridine synthase [Pseudopedobacter sp.]|uniref:RluA family pseudouridine synthase n=1 Tax=Pseudopedobacter sp. TaxID=1936787 RepID=UPI00333F4FDA
MRSDFSFFTKFSQSVSDIPLPEKFNYPFYYEPHPLCIIAAEELQQHLENQKDWIHNFGLDPNQEGLIIGKMFGVLVVKDTQGNLGYISAFSGKLAGANHHPKFVPPVFDLLEEGSFFIEGEKELNEINRRLEQLEGNRFYKDLIESTTNKIAEILIATDTEKQKLKEGKKQRKHQRESAQATLNQSEYNNLCERLKEESLKQQYFAKLKLDALKIQKEEVEKDLVAYESEINQLKELRKEKSAALQQRIFEQYTFLNIDKKQKSLSHIFNEDLGIFPPAGAGECAAPKLLQYAFLNDLKPIAMAEFWWGQSPVSEIRRHKNFYPACRGKCEPILNHMLVGMKVDENPMLQNPAEGKQVEIVYDDEYLCVINKPAEFLSVPGINITDSVYERMRAKFPEATGPLIVHRLDMSTSGIMLIAKSKDIYTQLQSQFIKRTVQKRYVALLDGLIEVSEGIIDLPLRVDLEDRPRQMVCYEYGKPAKTKWRVLENRNGQTRVHFWPITGRTHQLRVHSAHKLGLNCPIAGDDIYGVKANRLHLHAEWIQFYHPVLQKTMSINVEADF